MFEQASPPVSTGSRAGRRTLLSVVAVVVVTLAGAGFGSWAAPYGLFKELELKAYDICFVMRSHLPESLAPKHKPAPITLVWMDSKTDDYLKKPRMLWPPFFG